MAATVNKSSRLRFADLAFVTGPDGTTYEFWDLAEIPEIPVLADDRQYKVKAGDRLDLLAFQHYGSSRWKYVIAIANDIELEPVELNEGVTIRIPSPSYVLNRFPSLMKF